MPGTLYKHLPSYLDDFVWFRNFTSDRTFSQLLEDNSEQFPLQQWIIYWKKAAPSGAAKHQKKKDQKRIQTYSPINLTNDQSA